jgi:hypothetical protein
MKTALKIKIPAWIELIKHETFIFYEEFVAFP